MDMMQELMVLKSYMWHSRFRSTDPPPPFLEGIQSLLLRITLHLSSLAFRTFYVVKHC